MIPAPSSPEPRRLTAEQREALARAKRIALWIGLILPLAVITASTIVLAVWLPRMPDPAATHWGAVGGPDGFGAPATYVWLNVGLGYGLTLMMWAMASLSSPKRSAGLWSPHQRFLVAVTAGFAVFTSINNLASAAVQLDLEDAHLAPAIGGLMLISFGVWAIVSIAAWFAQPRLDLRLDPENPADPLPLAGSERAVWFGEVRPSKVYLWVVGGGVVVVTAATVMVFLVPVAPEELWTMAITRVLMVAVMVLIVVLCVAGAWFKVRIDASGLEARSVIGWPTFRLPASDVQHVEAAQINPFAEFGGWGLRWTPGRFGLVMRTGEGILATRTDGRLFAVTVDDSVRAAAMLSSAARRVQE